MTSYNFGRLCSAALGTLSVVIAAGASAQPQCSTDNLLSDSNFAPGTALGSYTNNSLLDQWQEENATVESGSVGCVMPTTPSPPGMLHLMETFLFASQVRQVVQVPGPPSVAGDYAIATARFNSPTAGSTAAISLGDGSTLVPIPGAAKGLTLDDDCTTWEEITLCIALPIGTQSLNFDLSFTNGTIPQGGFVDEASLTIHKLANVITDPLFAPGTPLGSYTNNAIRNMWLQEEAVVQAGALGCVAPTTPGTPGMLHLMETFLSVSQVRQVVDLPGGPSVSGDYAIATARFNSPTAGSVCGLSLGDGNTLGVFPGAAMSLALDGDCSTWEVITICVPLPVGTQSLNFDLLFSNGTIPQGGFVDEAHVYVCGGAGCPGTPYCQANPNSTGFPGLLSACGSAVASANNLTLSATQLPPNMFGFFVTSMSQGFVPNPAGSAGNLCLGGAIGRISLPGQILNAGAAGAFSLALDLTNTPTPGGFVAVVAGQTWNYQAWHRDIVAAQATSNFTEGVSVNFL